MVGSLFAYFHIQKWQFFQEGSMEPPLYLPLRDVFFLPPMLSMHLRLQNKYVDPSFTKQNSILTDKNHTPSTITAFQILD